MSTVLLRITIIFEDEFENLSNIGVRLNMFTSISILFVRAISYEVHFIQVIMKNAHVR